MEQQRCYDSLDYIISKDGIESAQQPVDAMQSRVSMISGDTKSNRINTPYMNTIHPNDEPDYPGDLDLENKIS